LQKARQKGFTLIEMAIVLVIIGLVVGGVLVGQSLINAAAARAQISQIEKYNAAVNTFRGKYGYLPGDIKDPDASTFGFAARGQYPGEGDGNGVIEGVYANSPGENFGLLEIAGEAAMFWVDLSKASLIKEAFNAASPNTFPSGATTPTSVPNLSAYFPSGQLGSTFICVYSWNGTNYYALLGITDVDVNGYVVPTAMLSVQQAFSIDTKIDDGFPQTGNVTAVFPHGTQVLWTEPPGTYPAIPYNNATAGSSTTCFDNGGVFGRQQYSMTQNGGAGVNCALSFQFQ
jgi:prepilin-type N-terminal cleavage/methylation domain-containing protein